MNIKNNKKSKDSVDKIKNAIFNILKESTHHELSIKYICDVAKVNRSTFYAHFDSVEDVLYNICEEYILAVYQTFLKTNLDYKVRLRLALEIIKSRYDFFVYVFTSVPNLDMHVMDMIESSLYNMPFDSAIDYEKAKLSLSFMMGGFVSVGKRYFYDIENKKSPKMSLDEFVELLYGCINVNNPSFKVE